MSMDRNNRLEAVSQATRALMATALAAVLGGCAVGPDYVRPSPQQDPAFVRQEAEKHEAPQPADAEFWRSFGDPLLERLVGEALVHNHDLRIALASYQQANALLGQARLDRLPTITANAQASDLRTAEGDASPDGRRYEAGLGAIWELDFFGRVRRAVEAQRADTEASAADLAALQVAVVGEIAHTYFQLRGLQEQLRIASMNAESQSRTQRLLHVRFQAGIGTVFDTDRIRAQVESTYARIPALEAEIAFAAHRLAVLAGVAPGVLAEALEKAGALPPIPERGIATGTPSELLRRRPDVAAAERRLAAATARIGVATADLFPRFTISGLIGTQALDSGALFRRDSETRLLTLGIDGSFLNVGRVRARIAATDAAAAAHLAAYERSVLLALEETENALIRAARSHRELEHLQRSAQASARAAHLARVRLEGGAIDVLELLDAEREGLRAEDAYAQGRMRRAQAHVLVYRTLAGGWPSGTQGKTVALSHPSAAK
jgi:multidrug efflux system outer membrane protein